MAALKHVGRIKKNGSKVVVVFRTLPDDPHHALVLGVSSLSDMYHNSLMQLLEDQQGQQAYEFGEAMASRFFPDGRQMLTAMHLEGRLTKVPTSEVEMTPTPSDTIALDKLNEIIAEQQGVDLKSLSTKDPVDETAQQQTTESKTADTAKQDNGPLSDQDLARSLRSQADSLYKEAARLRKQADELDPPKKKTAAKKEETVSV